MISAPPQRERWTPLSPEDQSEVLRALEEVLASQYFSNSKRYPAVLRYLVEQALLGRGDEIKERTVGIEVFGRAPDYDTNLDTIVRYTAGEVRKRLALYYHEAEASIQIGISARSYSAEFLRPVDVVPTLESDEKTEREPLPPRDRPQELVPENTRIRGRLAWSIIALSAALLLFIGIRSWNDTRSDAMRLFWGPILNQKTPTIISLGGLPFPQYQDHVAGVASDDGSGNPYLSFESGLAMGRIVAVLNAHGHSYRVQPATTTTITQIRESPTVLIGAYNNDWTLRLTDSLRFHFAALPEKRIVDTKDPSRSWARDPSKPFGDTADYALVARFRDPSTDSMIVVIAGLQRFGTDAASQFVTSRDLLEQFDRQVGRKWGENNVEVVLRVDAMKGRTAAPIVVASDVW